MDEEDVVSADAEQTAEPTEDEAFEAALFPKGDDAGETDEADDEEPEEDDDSDDDRETTTETTKKRKKSQPVPNPSPTAPHW